MKVAVWIDSAMVPSVGGGFSYNSKLVELLDKKTFNSNLEVCFISANISNYKFTKPYVVINTEGKKLSFFQNAIVELSRKTGFLKRLKRVIQQKHNNEVIQKLHFQIEKNKIDLIYYVSPMQCYIPRFPFISTNWDLGHLTLPPFPEVTEPKELMTRTNWYEYVLPKAKYIFTESESGKKELTDLLAIPEDKIKVVPIFPGNLIHLNVTEETQSQILNKLKLEKNKFFMYPAQFWKHKNHERLISAFESVLKNYPSIKLVLSGSDKGELENILSLIKAKQLESSIIYTGFVSNEELYTLYKNALALVFPSLLGPTNMPPLEARVLGCPVLCSDFLGHREQLGDGALYFNPENEDEIVKSMLTVLDDIKRESLLDKASVELANSKFNGNNAVSKIEEHLLAALK